MINDVKGEIEKRTGLPANVVDQVVNALGEIVSEKFPQYAGMIGPMLGIPTTQGGAAGTAGTTGTTGTTGAASGGGLPDLGGWGSLLGGQGQPEQGTQGGQQGSQGGGTTS